MAFTGTNVGQSMQPQLSNYLGGPNHLHRTGPPTSTPSYSLFHPAAMAAVAAAAAGYSQQFGACVGTAPLNLTSTPNALGPYQFQPSGMGRANYYSNLALQHSNAYPTTYCMNGFPHYKAQQPFPVHPSPYTNPIPSASPTTPVITNRTESSVPKCSASKTPGVKPSVSKGKKLAKSEEMAVRKRQEFEELVKARTDKLLSDGPMYTPNNGTGPISSSSSVGSTGLGQIENAVPNYTKLIQAVLDAKKAALLRSPEVVSHLQRQQRTLSEYKRQTELFCVDVKK